MDQEKIGRFIYELRTKNKMTQKSLADRLFVTSQAISKWENGRGIPDIEQIKRISDIFGVSMKEIIEGEIAKPNINTRNNKKKIIILLAILVVFVLSLVLLFYKREDNFTFRKINADNSCFLVKGIVAFNKNKKSIYISNIECNRENDYDYLDIECILYEMNNNVENIIYEYGDIKEIDSYDKKVVKSLNELLNNVEFDIDGYDCSCNNSDCNNLYLRINALNVEDEIVTYNIPLALENKCFD